ncbi:MAG: histidine phosphatase family protein [Acidimicrobiales bacterium]
MVRVLMVRHGRAAAGWNVDPDPPLDDLGRAQALAAAAEIVPRGPMRVVTSPLLRCRQTAFPTSASWDVESTVDDRVGEIPSPEGYTLENRVEWLRVAMAGTWTDVVARSGDRYAAYRASVVDAVASLREPTVIFSHFIAINVVIGAATGDDRVVPAGLDNCSITVFDVADNGAITLVETGGEADTLIR